MDAPITADSSAPPIVDGREPAKRGHQVNHQLKAYKEWASNPPGRKAQPGRAERQGSRSRAQHQDGSADQPGEQASGDLHPAGSGEAGAEPIEKADFHPVPAEREPQGERSPEGPGGGLPMRICDRGSDHEPDEAGAQQRDAQRLVVGLPVSVCQGAIPRTAQARALSGIDPSGVIGSRSRMASRSRARRSGVRLMAYPGAGAWPPRKGVQ